MKIITVSIPETLHRRDRVRAAELDTSLSALVRQFLTTFAGEETELDRLLRLERDTLASIEGFRVGERMTRDELHDRDALR